MQRHFRIILMLGIAVAPLRMVAKAAADHLGARQEAAASQPSITVSGLPGSWRVSIGDVEQTLQLDRNGNFSQEGNTGSMSGTWLLDGNVLVLTTNHGLKVRSPILKLTDTQLIIRLLGAEEV